MIEGQVRNLTDFGAFVEIEDGIDGLVHVSDLTWTKRVKHPSEVLKKGDEGEGDRARHRAGESAPVARPQAAAARCLGELLRTRITSATWSTARSCALAQLRRVRRDRRGRRRPLPRLGSGRRRTAQPLKLEAGPGARVQDHQDERGREEGGLSIRAVGEEASRADVEAYKHPASSTGASTIGELINWKRASNDQNS